MVAGTASHVGKSWMTTAICRWLTRQGYRVAPFKAQNMSNNSYPCVAGGEIGRAQVAQAQACFLEPEPDMNPILLKPNSDIGSQVVVHGKVWQTLPAREYYAHFPFLLERVLESYFRLAARFDFIVLEGAGSISELNLKKTDLVNLGLATRLNIPVMLTADIDRGGVFASIVGTFELLDDCERRLVRSFVINRFRGDRTLFCGGVKMLEERTGAPCVGVFPWLANVPLDAEDSVAFESNDGRDVEVAIVALPRVSNLTDFRLIPGATRVTQPVSRTFGAIILPGTKNTLDDLQWLRETGLARWVVEQYRAGARILGICGGYQMLGELVEDPGGMESSRGSMPGLGLLAGKTVLTSEKVTRRVRARTPSGISFEAYEIHLGHTTPDENAEPFAMMEDGTREGIRKGRIAGTYLHGAIEDANVLGELLGRPVEPALTREATFEALADWFEANVDRQKFEELYLCS
jgi:adenosylcobyric acid synthase